MKAEPDLDIAKLTDSHCHLTCAELSKEVEAILERAQKAGVERLLTIGQGLEDSLAAIELAGRCAQVKAAVGFGPHVADGVTEGDFEKLAQLAKEAEVVALGEVGLDYYYDEPNREIQRPVFAEQVRLAAQLDLPVVIHCRDAWEDCLAVLDENARGDVGGVFHCYTGSAEMVEQLIERGFYISFAGMVTFKNANECRAAAKKVPLDRLLIETDSPYLSPEPMRTVRPNEPALLVHTVRFMAELLGVAVNELAELSSRNAQELFGW